MVAQINAKMFTPDIHHRHSIRLKNYDYSSPGMYFVTIVVQHRAELFGSVSNGQLHLNTAGEMVKLEWLSLPNRFPNIGIDVFVVMPNHFHGIIAIYPYENRAATRAAPTLGGIIGAFKSITTTQYIAGVKNLGWEQFDTRLWQRNYWDHIIRNEEDLMEIREYIHNNPLQWMDDDLHPQNS